MTTGAGGAIAAGNTWWYFKFGDTTKPALSDSGTWYLLVSLKPVDGGDQTTQNNAAPPAVTIMDMTGALNPGTLTSAFRVHNGAATGATDARRIEATNSGGADVWALSRTENNQVAQGYGSDATGDFELAVPVGAAFDAKIQNVIWPASASPASTGLLADVDIALGAADTTPPAAPASLTAVAGDGQVALSLADRRRRQLLHGVQVAGADPDQQHHELHVAAAGGRPPCRRRPTSRPAWSTARSTSSRSGPTTRRPTSARRRKPRPQHRSSTPISPSRPRPRVVAWGRAATLSGALSDGAEPFTAGQQVRAEYSYDGTGWELLQLLSPAGSFTYSVNVRADAQDACTGWCSRAMPSTRDATSDTVAVAPKVKLGKPVAPSSVKKGQARFTAYGNLAPEGDRG